MEMMMMAREIVVETKGVMDVVAAEETARLADMQVQAKETVKVIINNPVVGLWIVKKVDVGLTTTKYEMIN